MSQKLTRLALLAALAALAACRGQVSEAPPIHIVPDMDWQPRYDADEESTFFADKRVNRPHVEGTVVRGSLREDTGPSTGKVGGQYLAKAPITVDRRTLEKGQQRFAIFCTPCHDASGSGNGMVVQRGYPKPVELYSDHTRGISDGEIFDYITSGRGNMPAYGPQIPEQDRWAIVAWVRVLQRSQHGAEGDVPDNMKNSIEPEAAP